MSQDSTVAMIVIGDDNFLQCKIGEREGIVGVLRHRYQKSKSIIGCLGRSKELKMIIYFV